MSTHPNDDAADEPKLAGVIAHRQIRQLTGRPPLAFYQQPFADSRRRYQQGQTRRRTRVGSVGPNALPDLRAFPIQPSSPS